VTPPGSMAETTPEAVIFREVGADPRGLRMPPSRAGHRTTFVAVPDVSSAPGVARQLADEGFGTIDLCGGIGLVVARQVVDAVGGRLPVGLVAFATESVARSADFRARALAREPRAAAFLVLEAGADPAVDRSVRESGSARLTIVAVPDEDAAADISIELVERGVGLIELYGGFGSATAARLTEAVAGRAAIGSVGYGREALPTRRSASRARAPAAGRGGRT